MSFRQLNFLDITLYIFSTSMFTLFILYNDDKYIEKRYLFFLSIVCSFFIHLFLFIQIITYVIIKEIMYVKKFSLYNLCCNHSPFAFPYLPEIISYIFNSLFPMYHYDYSFIHRGISLSTFIKPIMAIYTFLLEVTRYHCPLTPLIFYLLFME